MERCEAQSLSTECGSRLPRMSFGPTVANPPHQRHMVEHDMPPGPDRIIEQLQLQRLAGDFGQRIHDRAERQAVRAVPDADFDAVDVLGQLPIFAGWQIDIADTPGETFRKQFLAKRSVEIVLSVAGAFALVLALSGVGNSLARTMAEARTPIGIRFALGASPNDLGRAYFGGSLKDLALAGVLVCAGGVAVKTVAPTFAEAVQLWVLLPALAGLLVVCGLMTHMLLGRMARRHTVIALVNGTAAPGRAAARGA